MWRNSFLKRVVVLMLVLPIIITVSACESAKSDTVGTTVTSGRVNTHDKFSFQYGRIDASIKLPKTANGLWPAFWLMGEDYHTVGWPQCAEIDILEMGNQVGIIAGTQERFLTRGTHWGVIVNGGHPAYSVNDNAAVGLQDEFHLYTMIWDENYIRMYLDLDKNPSATPYYEMLISSTEGEYPVAEYFHKPFFILFNLAVGGDFPQMYNINEITALNEMNSYQAKMFVDFVKVYNLDNVLIWEDSFDNSVIDENKWNIEINNNGGGNNELQAYCRQNVAIAQEPITGKSCLVLTAKRK